MKAAWKSPTRRQVSKCRKIVKRVVADARKRREPWTTFIKEPK